MKTRRNLFEFTTVLAISLSALAVFGAGAHLTHAQVDPEPVPQPSQPLDNGEITQPPLEGVAALWPDRNGLITFVRRHPERFLEAIENVIGTLGKAAQQNAVNAIMAEILPKTKDLGKEDITRAQEAVDTLTRAGAQNVQAQVVDGKVVISYDKAQP